MADDTVVTLTAGTAKNVTHQPSLQWVLTAHQTARLFATFPKAFGKQSQSNSTKKSTQI
jgi:hypothetical protein